MSPESKIKPPLAHHEHRNTRTRLLDQRADPRIVQPAHLGHRHAVASSARRQHSRLARRLEANEVCNQRTERRKSHAREAPRTINHRSARVLHDREPGSRAGGKQPGQVRVLRRRTGHHAGNRVRQGRAALASQRCVHVRRLKWLAPPHGERRDARGFRHLPHHRHGSIGQRRGPHTVGLPDRHHVGEHAVHMRALPREERGPRGGGTHRVDRKQASTASRLDDTREVRHAARVDQRREHPPIRGIERNDDRRPCWHVMHPRHAARPRVRGPLPPKQGPAPRMPPALSRPPHAPRAQRMPAPR